MPPEAFTAAAHAVTGSTSAWNIIALAFICVVGALSVWLSKRADTNVKLAAAETELRKMRRDQQIGELQSRFNDDVTKVKHSVENAEARVHEINAQLDKHVEMHKETEGRAHTDMRGIYERLGRMENTMIRRDEVEAKIEKVEAEIGRMNDRLSTKMDRMTDLLNTVLGGIATGSTHTKKLLEGGA